MSKTVIFSEKPSQARAYAQAFKVKSKDKTSIELEPCSTFPDGATITWGIGHLVGLKMPGEYKEEWKKWSLNNLPIIPDDFQHKVTPNVKEQYKAVKRLFDEATTIINGADQDREGSNIHWSTLSMTGNENMKKTAKRLWVNSLEEDEIRKGFNNLSDVKKDLLMYEEAKARQKADWLVGMNASQLYTLLLQKKGYNGSLSIGRVQSPTVYLIYQRQKEIENFVSKPFYQIESEFTASAGVYKSMAAIKDESKDAVQALLEKHNIIGNEQGTIESVEKKEKRQKPPKLHSLSTLQSTANKKWKYSPKSVLDTVQSLYDKKILSYPRTDSNFITESEFEYVKNNIDAYKSIINAEFNVKTLESNKRYVDGSKVEEHYAIIPTKTIPGESSIKGLSEQEKNIYHEVIATTLGMFHEDYIYEETTIMTHVNDLPFKTTGKVEKDKGWKKLFPKKEEKKEEKEVLPAVEQNEKVQSKIGIKEGWQKAPKPYTEGQLINMMKTCGKHVESDEDVEILKAVEGLGTEATRSNIIENIKQREYIEVKKNIVSVTDKGKILCEAIEGTLLASPSMTAKWESYLSKIGKGEGSQKTFIEKITQFINKMIEDVPNKLNAPSVDQSIKSKQESDSIAQCPSCGNSIIDKGKFYGCSGYKEGCKVTFPKKWAKKTLGKKIIQSLCENKKTNKLKGFKSKAGKDFEAKLILDEKYSLKFDFK